MAITSFSDKINALFNRGNWQEARRLLEAKRAKDPENHWVLTQLGVTFYEQRQYEEARRLFEESLEIVEDCPLTIWHLAGALDALGKHNAAKRLYTYLLSSDVSPEDDPCWESAEWTEALKTDCLYRLGVCLQHLGKKRAAEQCFRQYVDLLFVGVEGSYSIEDVQRHLRELHGDAKNGRARSQLRKAIRTTLAVTEPEA